MQTKSDYDTASSVYMLASNAAHHDYEQEQCRLDGLYKDAIQQVSLGGGTVDASYYDNGTSSVNVQVCFAAGEKTHLESGVTKNVEEVEVGDMVMAVSQDDPFGPAKPCRVVRVFHNAPQRVWQVAIRNGVTNDPQTIRVTGEHPFFVKGKGWVQVKDLEPGDTFRNMKGEFTQVFVEKTLEDAAVPVYNFEVEGAHTYFVGENDGDAVLVHNVCDGGDEVDPVDIVTNAYGLDNVQLYKLAIAKSQGKKIKLSGSFGDYVNGGGVLDDHLPDDSPYLRPPTGFHWGRNNFNRDYDFLALTESFLAELARAQSGETKDFAGDTWVKYSPAMSIYHSRNGSGGDCAKYVSTTGRELVISLSPQGKPSVEWSPKYTGTFNYGTGASHFLFDMLPYYFFSNGPNDSTKFYDRIYPAPKDNKLMLEWETKRKNEFLADQISNGFQTFIILPR